MIKYLLGIIFVLMVSLFGLGIPRVFAGCTTGADGWITCRDNFGDPWTRPLDCSQLGGTGTCGAGIGCGPTGCFDCTKNNNCNAGGSTPSGNNCPSGSVWNDCANGSNTCQARDEIRTCFTGNACASRTPVVPKVCNEKCGSDIVCDSTTPYVCNPVTITEDRNCRDVWSLTGCHEVCGWEERCYSRDRRGNCTNREWERVCHSEGCSWTRNQVCDRYSYTQNQCSGGQCINPHSVDRYCNTCEGQTTGGDCISTCQAGTVRVDCAVGSNTCSGGCVQVCNPNNWGACSVTCGGGTQTNECLGTRACNTQSCCTATQPNVNLVSPIGSSIPGPSVPLVWNVLDYGTGCPQNNSSTVYVAECPDPQGVWGLPLDWMNSANVVTNYSPYVGQTGKSYCWTVVVNNGSQSWYPVPKRWSFIDRPWWQVKGGGIMAGGDITSQVATGQKLIKDDNGVVAANGTLRLNNTSNTWQASNDPNIISNKLNYRYDYDSVYSRVYAHIKPTEKTNGWDLYNSFIPNNSDYNYVHVTGDLNTREDLNIGSNKLVILVEGDANLNYKINFDDNVGLFALYVKGNINIDPEVGTVTGTGTDPETLTADLEGIFLASGSINTGVSQKQLKIEGPVIGISGVNFQRNLYSQWPNEFIVFRPDILMKLPKPLLRQNNLWMEANP